MEKEDPFASMMELCEPTASQEFLRRPLTLDTWEDFSDDEFSSPAASEATAIVMYSVPGTPCSDHRLSPARVRVSEDEAVGKRVRAEQPIEVIEIEDSDSDESVAIIGEKRSDENMDGKISEELLRLKKKMKGKEVVQEKRGLLEMLEEFAAVIGERRKDEGGEADILKTAMRKGMELPKVRWWPPEGF